MNNIMLPAPHKILKVVKETRAEYTFRVAYEGETRHGQFFQLSIPKVGEAPISVSGKGEGWVEFTIRKVGRLTEGIFGLGAGDLLFMRGPYGNSFPVEEFEGKDLVVICGGTGMAPVKTLLNHFYDHPEVCPLRPSDRRIQGPGLRPVYRGAGEVQGPVPYGGHAGYHAGARLSNGHGHRSYPRHPLCALCGL